MADKPPSSGRARGRARGRGRATSGQQQAPPRRPGEGAPAMPMPMPQADPEPMPAPGRGRSRGASAQITGSGAAIAMEPRVPPETQKFAPPAAQMAKLSMHAAGGQGVGGISARSGSMQVRYEEPKTRPAHIRDKRGTKGDAVEVITNCFRLQADKQWLLYQYHVVFSPEVDNPRARQGLLRFHTEALGNPMAFDGMVLFLLRQLDQPVTVLETRRRDTDAIVTITITLRTELAPTSPTCIQVYNIIFRKILGFVGMQQIGRHYFNPNTPAVIQQHNLQLWPGFITSILQYEKEVMLMADVSHKILRTDTVMDIMNNILDKKRNRFRDEVLRMLVGEIVLTCYNNKTYRVDDIEWDMTPMNTFAKFDGTQITYAQYYEEAYNKKIQDVNQPLLISRPKKKDERRGMTGPIHLIPELCMLTGLSEDVRSDFHVMKDIAEYTRIAPQKRLKRLTDFVSSFPQNQEARDYLKRWQISFEPQPVKIRARILERDKILLGHEGKAQMSVNENAEWSRDIRNELLSCKGLHDWLLIFTSRDQPKAMDFLQTMTRVAPKMGVDVREPRIHQLNSDGAQYFVGCIRQNLTESTQMVVCILPTNRKDRYDAIKKFCCLEAPVPSQCILARTVNKKQTIMSVCTKIAMQINCKMGGELWAVPIPSKVPMMVVGIDSYHDSSTRGRSVGGFVASMNHSLTRYYSRCTFQHTGQELIDGLKVCMHAALENFNAINGCLPQRVVIYRDGVGDGQLPAVVEHELPQILDTFKSLGTDYMPKCAVVVVKKRINNRFFCVSGGQLRNPLPGTFIDSVVTKPQLYDFFLVSQSVRQGTVTPTSYNVIWDTSGFNPDHIQSLTYKLTHLYFNWPGTIRVPAPCLYAHKLSFLVGQSLHKTPRLELADRLFYL